MQTYANESIEPMSRELRPAPLGRCLLVWLARFGGARRPDRLAPARPAGRPRGRRQRCPARQPFDQVLVWVCEAALLGTAGWLWLVTGLLVRDAARGRSPVRRGVPAPVRRLVLVACGAALAGGLATPSYAAPVSDAGDRTPARAPPSSRDFPSPTGPPPRCTSATSWPGAARPSGVPAPRTRRRAPWWSGPATRCGGWPTPPSPPTLPSPPSAERWHRIYRANRGVIGPDPDLIQPDQRLRLPRR